MAQRQETLEERTGSNGSAGLHAASPAFHLVDDVLLEPTVPSGVDQRIGNQTTVPLRSGRHAAPRSGRGRHRGRHHRRGRGAHVRRSGRAAQRQSLVYVERMPLWKSSLLAVASLVFVLGIAFAVMAGMGQLIHVLNPAKHFDIFYALHTRVTEMSLLAASILWLLPPHPWAKRLVEVTPRHMPPSAGETGAWVLADVTVLPRPEPRSAERSHEPQGVGG